MNGGKVSRLNAAITNLVRETNGRITSLVVTTDRGLIVAGVSSDRVSKETLAAMTALVSDTSIRVCNNMELDRPKATSIKTRNATIILVEFLVKDSWFRIGAKIVESFLGNLFLYRKHLTVKEMEEKLYRTSRDISRILSS